MMRKSKLILTLATFDEAKWKEFRLFLQSPYHNRGKESAAILRLFQFCYAFRRNFSKPGFTKEAAYEFVFPRTAEVGGKLEKLMSNLYKLTGEFIVLDQREPTGSDAVPLANYFVQHDLPDLAESLLVSNSTKLSDSQNALAHADLYWQQFQTYKALAYLYQNKGLITTDQFISQALTALDQHYLVLRLEYACGLHSQGIHHQINLHQPLAWLDQLLPSIEQSAYLQNPLIKAYFLAYHLLKNNPNDTGNTFDQLKRLLEESEGNLPAENIKSLQTILRIHAIAKYNKGKAAYLNVAMELYKKHLDRGWLYFDQKIMPETALNMVTLGLRAGDTKWVLDFLNTHRNRFAGGYASEETYQFNLAICHFHQGLFEEAYQLLSSQNFQNLYYKVAARRLELMVLYEQNSVLLASKMEAFKMFIFRLSKTQMPENHKQLNNHFIDFLKQLTHPATMGNPGRIEKIRIKINQRERVAERNWLLKKVEKL
ncbi:MAG: hypothetical protein JNJ57_15300 [Saprospiraceae bacterium]|nr:hypothetical protein [Saprospiraceae bacterium]